MKPGAIDVQGHRGAAGHWPENTLPGFEAALALGVTTLELDTGVTRDGVPVAHHDRRLNPDLARGADGRWIDPPGALLKDLSFAELQRYDVGRIRPGSALERRYPLRQPLDGTRIPALSAVLALPARFNIETKISPAAPHETLGPEAFARALIAEVRNAKAAARATIQSFDWRTLKVVEREAPEIATVYLTDEPDADPRAVHAAGGRIWSPDFGTLTATKAEAARALGLELIVWTVNEPADIERMLDLGVDGIISDYPERVREALARRGLAPRPRL